MTNDENKASNQEGTCKPAWEAPVVISVEVMEVMASSCAYGSDPECSSPPATLGKNQGTCTCTTYGS
ncbi:hypothetical protein [Solemya velum gill symbiont]|uniref:hypothetical protein n=1 Tax=Solemya velum gill symbiont TaxID=2340 RepID=UPI00117B1AE6|nr:hypothetical protein [Solemya velum gill symbiont]